MAQIEKCGICNGKGYIRCPICEGAGKIKKEAALFNLAAFRAGEDAAECQTCQGSGRRLCKACEGAGKLLIEKPGSTGFRPFS